MSFFKTLNKRQDEETFELLIKNEQVKLYKIAYMYVRNEQDALDIVQDTIIKGYKSYKRLKEIRYFSTWITRILINTSLDFLKKQRNVVVLEPEIFRSEFQLEKTAVASMDLAAVFEKLKPDQKTLLLLRFYYGYTVPEMAEIIGKPEGTVKSQLHRTLQVVKKKLEEGGNEYGEASARY